MGLRVTGDPETEAHMPRLGRIAPPKDAPETEAHAALRISFPPDAGEQTLTVVYRPAADPGEEPEVELHGFTRWSDRSLKRDIRTV